MTIHYCIEALLATYVNNLDLIARCRYDRFDGYISEYNLQTDEGDFLYKNADGTVSYVPTPRKDRGTTYAIIFSYV